MRSPLATLLAALFLGLVPPTVAEEGAETGYDKVWAMARLYSGDDESFLQSFDLSGRLQLDLA